MTTPQTRQLGARKPDAPLPTRRDRYGRVVTPRRRRRRAERKESERG